MFRYTENVIVICTDCNLFAKFFLTNSYYLYGSLKFSPVKFSHVRYVHVCVYMRVPSLQLITTHKTCNIVMATTPTTANSTRRAYSTTAINASTFHSNCLLFFKSSHNKHNFPKGKHYYLNKVTHNVHLQNIPHAQATHTVHSIHRIKTSRLLLVVSLSNIKCDCINLKASFHSKTQFSPSHNRRTHIKLTVQVVLEMLR